MEPKIACENSNAQLCIPMAYQIKNSKSQSLTALSEMGITVKYDGGLSHQKSRFPNLLFFVSKCLKALIHLGSRQFIDALEIS